MKIDATKSKMYRFASSATTETLQELYCPKALTIPLIIGKAFYKEFCTTSAEERSAIYSEVGAITRQSVDMAIDQLVDLLFSGPLEPLRKDAGTREAIAAFVSGVTLAATAESRGAASQFKALREELSRQLGATIAQVSVSENRRVLAQTTRRFSGGRETLPTGRPAIHVPDYEILQPIGSGGFGSVFLSRHVRLDSVRALKICPITDEEMIARFKREQQIMRTVEHPNVVRHFEHGILDSHAWVAMAYVGRYSLADLQSNDVDVPPEFKCALALDVNAGLSHLHELKLIHRDLKPANIVIDDNSGRAVIVDCGLLRPAETAYQTQTVTKSSIMVGTPTYMSPEQLMGDPITDRSDAYSFGVIIHEHFCGRPIFSESHPTKQALAIKTAGDAPPVDNALPREFVEPLRISLRVDPAHRVEAMALWESSLTAAQTRFTHDRDASTWEAVLSAGWLTEFLDSTPLWPTEALSEALQDRVETMGLPKLDDLQLIRNLCAIAQSQNELNQSRQELQDLKRAFATVPECDTADFLHTVTEAKTAVEATIQLRDDGIRSELRLPMTKYKKKIRQLKNAERTKAKKARKATEAAEHREEERKKQREAAFNSFFQKCGTLAVCLCGVVAIPCVLALISQVPLLIIAVPFWGFVLGLVLNMGFGIDEDTIIEGYFSLAWYGIPAAIVISLLITYPVETTMGLLLTVFVIMITGFLWHVIE